MWSMKPTEWPRPEEVPDTNDLCGPEIFHSGFDDPAVVGCVVHDRLYAAHHAGDDSMTRKEVDDAMLKIALANCGDNPGRRRLCYSYYFWVRLAGWYWWNWGTGA